MKVLLAFRGSLFSRLLALLGAVTPLALFSCGDGGHEKEDVHSSASSTPEHFAGGPSDIDSRDEDRAAKAFAKWTSPDGTQGGRALSGAPFHWDYSRVGQPVFLRIIKDSDPGDGERLEGRLEAWLEDPGTGRFELFKTYRIARFSGTLGPKTREGDHQAPEGFYEITPARMNPMSAYHLSMNIGYPNAYDRALERTGSLIMIHGAALSVGCYAMTDCSVEQIYTLVQGAFSAGQPPVRVHCFPVTVQDLSA